MVAFAKHFINDPNALLLSALRAVPQLNGTLRLDEENKTIYWPDDEYVDETCNEKVRLVSGGGAGHEPSFVSYVGKGMLSAAVSGSIFASPSPSQIYNAIRLSQISGTGDNPVLLIVMNYTGDVLNFGLGAEKIRASDRDVSMVVVGDDVGVGREKSGKVGRRGIAGTVLVHKIVGAFADTGPGLLECKELAELVSSNLVSVGASLAHVHVPGHNKETKDTLGHNEIEIGMGIHNEQGSRRMEAPSLQDLVQLLLKQLLDKEDKDRAYLDWNKGDSFVLMVNNLGGTSPLELGGITNEVLKQLGGNYGIEPRRVYSGTFMTSLNGLGFSLTLLRLQPIANSELTMLGLLDAPVDVAGWPKYLQPRSEVGYGKKEEDFGVHKETLQEVPSALRIVVSTFEKVLSAALNKLKAAENEITRYDQAVGDGDCGTGLRKGAEAILDLIRSGGIIEDAVISVMRVADVVERSMDGTSGAIYSIFTNALARSLRELHDNEKNSKTLTLVDWSAAAAGALRSLQDYTPAKPGDRTLVDALHPFIETLHDKKDIKVAAQAARKGAQSTRGMRPKLGRTVYVGDIGDVPDPGAIGVAEFVEGLAEALVT